MKKLFYFTLLLSVALVFAQDEENGEEEVLSRCFNGTSGDDGGAITEVPCDFSTESCMTKYETNEESGFFKVVRECTQTLACENNAGGNIPKCYPGENGVRICFFCCESDLCNSDDLEIPEASGDLGEEVDGE